MPNKADRFSRGSENEKRFRAFICLLGALLFLYTAATLLSDAFSLGAAEDLFVRSAFITEDAADPPTSFIDESK